MEKTYGKVTEERQTGYKVVITSRTNHSSVEMPWETMYIGTDGNVIRIVHDSSCSAGGGFCDYVKDTPGFDGAVRNFMRMLLEKNVEEFKSMRSVLNDHWYTVAESVRKIAAAKFDF